MTVYHDQNSLQTKWHVKPTNTFLYTHHSAISPPVYKKNVIRALYSRSQRLTSDIDKKMEAKELVKHIFLKTVTMKNTSKARFAMRSIN